MAVSNIVSREDEAENNTDGSETDVERRDFELNKEKSLKKKLNSTKKDDIVMYESGWF